MEPRLTAEQRRAFIWVRDRLRSGALKHLKPDTEVQGVYQVPFVERLRSRIKFFSMSYWDDKTDCGTVCCIGGWVEARLGRTIKDDLSTIANDLFMPPDAHAWNKITPKQAARAIDNWLATGDPKWEKIFPR